MSERLQYCCEEHGWEDYKPCPTCHPASELAPARLLDALVQACTNWRKSEKRWAATYINGEGDLGKAKSDEDRKLNELRIAFDKWEASNDQALRPAGK